MTVFDLSEVQANYILEMPLRRLTKFSRIELEKEQDELRGDDRRARPRSSSRRALLRDGRSPTSSPRSPRQYGTPRRTVLLESAGAPATAGGAARGRRRPVLGAAVLDRPAGPDARPTTRSPAERRRGPSTTWCVSAVRTTARGEIGVVTTPGRLMRLGVLDLPALPATASAPAPVRAARRLASSCRSRQASRCWPVPRWPPTAPGLALGTAQGVVKRVDPDYPATATPGRSSRSSRRRPRSSAPSSCHRRARTSSSSPPTPSCCTSPPPRCARRAGRRAAWPGSGWPPGARSVFFGAVDPGADAVVVTVAGSSAALPGHRAGLGQGDAVRRVPGQGPRHRRRPLPPLPQGRGHPARWPGPVPRRRGRPRPPAVAGRPAGRRPAAATARASPAGQPIAAVGGPVPPG